MDHPDQLRARALAVLAKLRRREYDRPVFVEFSGTPKSGKSTCIDIATHFFRRLDYKVLAPAEGASRRTPYYLKDNWVAFNTWSASYALTHVLEGMYGSDKYDVAILDRGLFDALGWFQLLTTQEKITKEVRDTVHNFLLIDTWRSQIDAVLLFTTDPETALEREVSNKIIKDEGSAMNSVVLQQLNEAYEQVKQERSGMFERFNIINTSKSQETSPESTAKEAVARILDVLEARLGSDEVAG